MFEFKYGDLYLDGDKVGLKVSSKCVNITLGGGYVGKSIGKKIAEEIKKHYRYAGLSTDVGFIEYKEHTVMYVKGRLLVPSTESIWKYYKEELPEL